MSWKLDLCSHIPTKLQSSSSIYQLFQVILNLAAGFWYLSVVPGANEH
jgi:hypothetical protein